LILSTIPGGDVAFMSGTSQAAPIAAATAALMLERDNGVSPVTLIARMVDASDRLESLDGLASNPVRLNSARTLGIEADLPGEGDAITIRGLDADVDGLVSAEVTIGELGGQFNQKFHWEASLLTLVEGQPFAVTGHPVTVRDTEGDELRSIQTDQRGAVLLADKGASSAGWSTTLPDGSYALLIEAVPRTDPTVRLGDGFVARFDVGQSSSGGTGTGSDGSSDSGSDGTTGGSASPGATIDDAPEAEGLVPGVSVANGPGSGSGSDGAGSSGLDSGDASSGETPGDVDGDGASTTGDGTEIADGTGSVGADPDGQGSADGDTSPDEIAPGTSSPGGNGSAGGGDTVEDGEEDVTLGPDEASNGPWSITSVSPRTGPVDSENIVVIDGTFPEEVVVWFGDGTGETVFQSNESILVETPRHAAPETVDVSLRTRDGEVLVLPDAYAFVRSDEDSSGNPTGETGSVADDASVGDGGSSESAGSESGGDGGSSGDGESGSSRDAADGTQETDEEPTFDDDPDEIVAVGQAPPADESDDDQGAKSRNRQARANTTGKARMLPNGLNGVPMSGLDTIGGVPKCDEALCRTRRV
jgi:hypothetical protein